MQTFLEGTTLGATQIHCNINNRYLVGKYIVRADFLGYTAKTRTIYIGPDVETSEMKHRVLARN